MLPERLELSGANDWKCPFNLTASVASRKDHLELVIAKIVISLVFIWLLAWTPYAIVSLIGISGHGAFLSPTATMLPALFAKTSACINPFVYSLTHPKIKKELLSRLRCFNTSVSTNNSLTDTPIVHFRSRSYSRNPDANELEMQKVDETMQIFLFKSTAAKVKLWSVIYVNCYLYFWRYFHSLELY